MMLDLLCVGRIKALWCREGCALYEGRLKRSMHLCVRELPASTAVTPERQRDEESARALKAIERLRGVVWLLDERGERCTSAELAQALQQLGDRGERVTVILGGAYGFDDPVRKAADRVLRLSDMTLPHELCRLLFLEQLYRAMQILRGGAYHHV